MFYTPGSLALLLKVGVPTGFRISVELLMLATIGLVFHGVPSLRRMQQRYDDFHPDKAKDQKAVAA